MESFKTTRRGFLGAVGFSLAAGAVAASASAQPAGTPKKRPNVILYVVDDQGSTDAGCYGNPVIKTPGLDELAAHGTRFTHAFCTTASCSASRSVILSGLYHYNGQYGHEHAYHHFSSFPMSAHCRTSSPRPATAPPGGASTTSARKKSTGSSR